jgi:hypothetical protein
MYAAALYNSDGTGYTQQQFTITCGCGFEITKNKLGAFKFVRDLIKDDRGNALDSHLACAMFYFSPCISPHGSCLYQWDSPYPNQ